VAIVALLALGPWALYEIALSNVEGRPALPATQTLPTEEKQAIWESLKERGPIGIERLTPHAYILMFLEYHEPVPGANVAWFVARDHNSRNLRRRSMGWWHLSGAALTIWLTRNWSTGELLAKVAEIRRERQQPSNSSLQGTRDEAARP
jgi:hypothetical protein